MSDRKRRAYREGVERESIYKKSSCAPPLGRRKEIASDCRRVRGAERISRFSVLGKKKKRKEKWEEIKLSY